SAAPLRLGIAPPAPPPLVEARHPPRLVAREPLPPVAQRRRLFGLALRLLELPLVLQPLLLRLVLPAQRLLAGLLGVLAQLLQPGQLRRLPLPAAPVLVGAVVDVFGAL